MRSISCIAFMLLACQDPGLKSGNGETVKQPETSPIDPTEPQPPNKNINNKDLEINYRNPPDQTTQNSGWILDFERCHSKVQTNQHLQELRPLFDKLNQPICRNDVLGLQQKLPKFSMQGNKLDFCFAQKDPGIDLFSGQFHFVGLGGVLNEANQNIASKKNRTIKIGYKDPYINPQATDYIVFDISAECGKTIYGM